MKIVVMNTSDTEGGAARCAHRLHMGFQAAGSDSTYFVQKKFGTDESTLSNQSVFGKLAAEVRPGLDRLPMRLYRNRTGGPFSTGLTTTFSFSKINTLSPDIVNLHYVGEGFLPNRSLKQIKCPIVWTLHDSQPFTGGCHLPGECISYEQACGKCPKLGSNKPQDLSNWIWRNKTKAWSDLNLTIVTDSTWLAGCAQKSSLFRGLRVEAINPGLSLSAYKPIDKSLARSILSLPIDKKLILFGAMHSTSDSNKGFQYLKPAIEQLSKTVLKDEAELIIFGATAPKVQPDLGMKSHYLGRLHDDISLSVLYSAADVMVVPSIRESFGQTASEAMACGTPVVAFGATGLLDIVEHKLNGYLATPYQYQDLASGINWAISGDEAARKILSERARATAERKFSIDLMTQKYLMLFNDILKSNSHAS